MAIDGTQDIVLIVLWILRIGVVGAVAYYIIDSILPVMERYLSHLTGDARLAELFRKYVFLYLLVVAVDQMLQGVQGVLGIGLDMDLYLIGGLLNPALRLLGKVNWALEIGVLLFIGYAVLNMSQGQQR